MEREQLSSITSQDEVITEMRDKTFSLPYENPVPWASVPPQQQKQQMGTARRRFYVLVFLPDHMG